MGELVVVLMSAAVGGAGWWRIPPGRRLSSLAPIAVLIGAAAAVLTGELAESPLLLLWDVFQSVVVMTLVVAGLERALGPRRAGDGRTPGRAG